MSSVCGIVDLEVSTVDFEKLKNMGRRMILRGREQTGAYINCGVGFQHNRMILSGGVSQRQPYTLEVEGKKYVIGPRIYKQILKLLQKWCKIIRNHGKGGV